MDTEPRLIGNWNVLGQQFMFETLGQKANPPGADEEFRKIFRPAKVYIGGKDEMPGMLILGIATDREHTDKKFLIGTYHIARWRGKKEQKLYAYKNLTDREEQAVRQWVAQKQSRPICPQHLLTGEEFHRDTMGI